MKKQMNNLEKKIVMKNGKVEYATVETVIFKHSNEAIKAFAKKCVKNLAWTKNDFEYEDYVQAARMEVITMFDVYDEVHPFSSMLNTRLDQLYVYLLRYYGNKKRAMNNAYGDGVIAYNEIRLDDIYGDNMEYYDIIGSEDSSLTKSNYSMVIENCAKKLNDKEKRILAFLLHENETKFDFAKKIGMSRPTLDKKINQIRDMLKAELQVA